MYLRKFRLAGNSSDISKKKAVFRINSAIAAAMAACMLAVSGCGSAFGDPSAGGNANTAATEDEEGASEDKGQEASGAEEGASQPEEAAQNTENEASTDGVNNAENADSTEDSGAEAAANAEDNSAVAEGDTANAQDSTELYEKFLRNENTVLIKPAVAIDEYYWNLDNLSNMDVTLEGLVNGILSYYTDNNPNCKIKFESAEYAYIDCGNDGNKELALRFVTPEGNETWEEYIIIKAVDGVLETVYANVAWSRSALYIGEYGYIFGDGSGGAAYHLFDKSFIDADGKWHFIYSDESTTGIVADSSVNAYGIEVKIPSNAKLDVDYTLLEFDFNNTEMDRTDDAVTYAKIVEGTVADYENGYRSYFYSDLEADDSIYEDSNALKKLFDKEGLKIYTLSEIDQMIADKEAAEGLTEEVKNGGIADWQPLELTFSPAIATFNADNILKREEYFPIGFRFSKKAGADSYMTINADGSVEGNYSDWNYNSADGSSVTNKNEYTGQIVVSEQISDTVYNLQLVDFSLNYEVGTSEQAEYTKGSISTINYVDIAGLDDGCTNFRLYCPGTAVSELDANAVKGLPDYFMESNVQDDKITAYVLYGLDGKHYTWFDVY